MARWRNVATVLILAAGPMPAAAQGMVRPTIADAVGACVEAVTATGVDDQRLTSAGWAGTDIAMDRSDAEPLRVYTRGTGPLVVTGSGRAAAKLGCNVLSPLPVSAYAALVASTTTRLGVAPTDRDARTNDVLWVVGPTAVALSQAGTTDRPAVRFTVIQFAGKKK